MENISPDMENISPDMRLKTVAAVGQKDTVKEKEKEKYKAKIHPLRGIRCG